MVSLGGFFAQLVLKADQASFDRSKKELGEIEKQTKKTGQEFDAFVVKAVKGLLTVGAAAVGAAGALAMMQAKQNVVATRANLGTAEFVNFGNAIKMLSGNADQFIQSMSGMQSAFDNIKLGDADAFQKMATSLALLGQATGKNLDINQLQGMTQEQRTQAIAASVESTNYKTESGRNALTLADRMLPGLGDALVAARNAGRTFAQVYADASNFRMVNNSTMSNSSKNAYELQKTGAVLGQIGESGLEKILTALRPTIQKISDFLIAHEKDFDKFFTSIGELVSILSDTLGPALGDLIAAIPGAAGNTVDVLKAFQSGKWDITKATDDNLRLLRRYRPEAREAIDAELGRRNITKLLGDKDQQKQWDEQRRNRARIIAKEMAAIKYDPKSTVDKMLIQSGEKITGAKNNVWNINGITITGEAYNRSMEYIATHGGINGQSMDKSAQALVGLAATMTVSGTN